MSRTDALDRLGIGPETAAGAALAPLLEEIEAKGTLFSPGDVAGHLYLLAQGEAGAGLVELFVERSDSGRPSIIERVVEGVVGETEFVGRDEAGRAPYRLFGARVLRPTPLYRLAYRSLLSVPAAELAPLDRALAALTVERCRLLAAAGDAARHLDRPVLLAETLLRLAEDTGTREGAGLRLGVRKTQQELADEVGLSREAVNGHLNEWSRQGWLDLSQGQFVIRDVERLRRIVEFSQRPSRAAHDRALGRIDRVLGSGDSFRARNLALDLLRFYPASSELRHRAVLACLRAGAGQEADRLIAAFGFGLETPPERIAASVRRGLIQLTAGEAADATGDDEDYGERQRRVEQRLPALLEDVLGLPARRLKDLTFDGGGCDPVLARQAAAAYRRAFDRARRPYAGVNAAAMHLAAGEAEEAAELAGRVLERLPDDHSFWALATRAEALAWLGRDSEAGAVLRAAAAAPDAAPGAIATTRLQMSRLGFVLGDRLAPLLACLPQGGVAAFSGHMLPADAPDAGRYVATLAQLIGERLEATPLAIGFGALAAGPDIVFAEQIRARGGAFHAILPLRVDDFLAASTMAPAGGGGPDWQARARAALAAAASLTVAGRDRSATLSRTEIDDAIAASNRRSVGMALLRSDELMAEARLVAVWDGRPAWNVAGTARLVETCRRNGIAVEIIDCPWQRPVRKPPAGSDLAPDLHAPVLFVRLPERDGAARTALEAQIRNKALKVAPTAWLGQRSMRGGARSIVISIRSAEALLELGSALQATVGGGSAELRSVFDYGQVLKPDGTVFEDRLSRLEAANDLGELPGGALIATEAFAAEARFANSGWRFARAGRTAAGGQGAMPAPSLPLYIVEPQRAV